MFRIGAEAGSEPKLYQAFFSISNGKLLVQKFKTQTEIVLPFHFIIEDIVHGYEVPVPIRGSPISPIENPPIMRQLQLELLSLIYFRLFFIYSADSPEFNFMSQNIGFEVLK